MNIKTIFPIAILFFGTISCIDNQKLLPSSQNAVTLLLRDQNNDVNIEIVERIPLETTTASLFGESFRIHFFRDRFYILDPWSTETLFLFSKEGNYLNKIALGKGKGECLRVDAFYIDPIKNQVLVWDQGSKRMNAFDIDLNFLSSKKVDGKIIRQFERHKEKGWIVGVRERILIDERDYAFYHYSNEFDSIYQSVLPIRADHVVQGFMNPISRDTETPQLVVRHFDNNLYEFGTEELAILYTLDFGEYSIQEDDIKKGIPFMQNLMSLGKRKTLVDQLIHTKEYMAFSYYFRDKIEYYIYDKVSGKIYSSINLVNQGKLPYGRLMSCEDKKFILSIEQPEYRRFEIDLNGEQASIPNSTNEILLLFSIDDSIL